MRFIWNLLAVIGLVAVIAFVGGAVYVMRSPAFSDFDPKAAGVYQELVSKLMATGSIADATIWRSKVADGLTFEEVDQSIKTIAVENNIKAVGELPLSDQISAMTGKPSGKIKIYMYCNPLTAAKMIKHSLAFSAYLPCRIAVVEDADKQLWIYTLNMDPMIYGGKSLPPELKKEAIAVKKIMQDVLKRAASGDF